MSQPAVVFDRVWKKFRRGERHNSLRDLIPAIVKSAVGLGQKSDLEDAEFWALQDVSFEVHRGEALGIIGANGAGKSTTLKLLSRIMKPTRGRCAVKGRMGTLIEVAAGFHPDLTGRENVYLQGAIAGMSREEIARKFDLIVEFAAVSEFIDTPVKRYSSGMNARLGFAIAAHLDPDVLLIDEVLSVGDAAFQERCVEAMRDLINRGTPLVFVSHNLPAVLELCTRTIVVDHGRIKFDGDPGEALQQYRLAPWSDHGNRPHNPQSPIRIVRGELLDDDGAPSAVFRTAGQMCIRIHYDVQSEIASPAFAVDLHRGDGVYCAGINTLMDDERVGTVGKGAGYIDLVISKLSLLPGSYVASVGILDREGVTTLDVRHRALPFSVTSKRRDFGLAYLEHHWAAGSEVTRHADGPRLISTTTRESVKSPLRSPAVAARQ
jgi:lipopolysaccharide transport system ATP-binding protein